MLFIQIVGGVFVGLFLTWIVLYTLWKISEKIDKIKGGG